MNIKMIIALTLAASVVGCSSESQKVSAVNSDKKAVSSASVGKPSAPINMSYKVLTENPVPGQEIEIQVAFSSPLKSTVSASMKAAKDLTWVNSEKSWQIQASKSGQHSSIPNMKVVAPANGVYYIHLIAQIMDNGQPQFKPFTIPVNVGNAEVALQSPGEIVLDDKGQKVIIQKVDSNN